MYIVHNNHAPIIDREIYNRVKSELIRRKVKLPYSEKQSISAQGRYSRYALTEVLKCAECGSRFKRCTWAKNGKKKIVWRCISRLDYATKYCKNAPTVDEEQLKSAIVRALNSFNEKDSASYLTLMKATIGEASGLNSNAEEIEFIERQIEAQNRRMMELVNESVAGGKSIKDCDADFKDIAEEIERLKKLLSAINTSDINNKEHEDKLQLIDAMIESRKMQTNEYDDSIVIQMVECIKVYSDGN